MRDCIKKIVPISLRTKIRKYLYVMNRVRKGRKVFGTKFESKEIKSKGKHVFFGYYDITPFGKDGNVLFHEIDEKNDVASIGLYNIENNEKKYLANTKAWNWQQGSRLRWHPTKSDVVVFNDFNGIHYISREISINDNKELVHPFPIYDVSPNGKLAITLDFTRLGYMRPGYGYTILPFNKNDISLDDGIDIFDLCQDSLLKTVSYRDLSLKLGLDQSEYVNWYLNHLSFSPNGDKFLLFFIREISGSFFASLLVYNIKEESITVLEKDLKVSHYDWINNDIIICTACNNTRCWYNIYNCITKEKEIYCEDILSSDGHPTYLGDGRIITDTYPDKDMYQYIYLVDKKDHSQKTIAEVFQTLYDKIEKRTDLHPRVAEDKKHISFDCNFAGYREMVILNLNSAL